MSLEDRILSMVGKPTSGPDLLRLAFDVERQVQEQLAEWEGQSSELERAAAEVPLA